MVVLHALSYIAGTAAFLFVLLSLASGLLYVAEVIEEHSGLAKTIGQRMIYVVIALIAIIHFTDEIPWHVTALCILAHVVYLQNFSRTWPAISLLSPAFLASCVLVVASHFITFSYFSERAHSPRRYKPRHGQTWSQHQDESFMDVATFFGICIWLVPFYLFLSLSANDNVLPSAGEGTPTTPSAPNASQTQSQTSAGPPLVKPTTYRHSRKQSSIMKTALSSALSVFLRPRTSASLNEGLISPMMGGGSSRSPSPTIFQSQQWGQPSPSASGFSSPSGFNAYGSPPVSAGGGGGPGTYSPGPGLSSSVGYGRPLPPRRSATEGVLPERRGEPHSAIIGFGTPPPAPSPSSQLPNGAPTGLSAVRGPPLRKTSMEPLRISPSPLPPPPPPPSRPASGERRRSSRPDTPPVSAKWDGRASAPAGSGSGSGSGSGGWNDAPPAPAPPTPIRIGTPNSALGAEGMVKRKVG